MEVSQLGRFDAGPCRERAHDLQLTWETCLALSNKDKTKYERGKGEGKKRRKTTDWGTELWGERESQKAAEGPQGDNIFKGECRKMVSSGLGHFHCTCQLGGANIRRKGDGKGKNTSPSLQVKLGFRRNVRDGQQR